MRILIVAPGPSFSVADVQHGWERALAAQGHQVVTYNLDDRLPFFSAARWPDSDGQTELTSDEAIRLAVEPLGNLCYKFLPEVIIVISGFFIPEEMWNVWRTRKHWHKTVMLCTESPYEDDIQWDRMMAAEPDVVLLNDPKNIDTFTANHPRVAYLPHAYDPAVHHPGGARAGYESEFAFVGTGYPSRVDFFARADWRGIDLKLAGMWASAAGTCLEPHVMHDIGECFDNADAADLYRSCKVSANFYRARSGSSEANDERLANGIAIGPREVELAACGTFFLREPRPEGDALFPMLPTFTEPGEFADLLRYYLAHDIERTNAADRAREAIADRTFDAHARRLMQILSA